MKHTPGPWIIKENEKHETPSIYAGWRHIARLKDQSNGELYGNAHLIAAAPNLLEEHKQWAKILGHIFVMALQGDYEALQTYAKVMKIEFRDGEPSLKSEAIAKIERGESK